MRKLLMLSILVTMVVGCTPRLKTTDGLVGTGSAGPWVSPDNRWPTKTPPDDLNAEGWEAGQVVPDLRAKDQFGDETSLWQFYGRVVLLDISTMWCAPCRVLAEDTQHTADAYSREDFVYLTVLQEDVEGGPTNNEDLNLWADNFGILEPVVEDGDKLTAGAVLQGLYPAVLLIGRDLKVRERVNPPEDAAIRRAIDAAI